jgi:chaperone BCS1
MGSLFQFNQLTSAALPALPILLLSNNSVETTLPAQNDTLIDAAQNTMASATRLKMPTDFPSLLTFTHTFSALRDYLKLIVLGGSFEALRRLYSASYRSLVDRFFITATFESEDVSYGEHPFPSLPVTELTEDSEWMLFWLSSRPQFHRFRDFSVSTGGLSLDESALEIDDNMDEGLRQRTRPVRYLPSYSSSYWMWYKGRYITISRTRDDSRYSSTLRITSVSSGYVNCLIAEGLAEYFLVTVLS